MLQKEKPEDYVIGTGKKHTVLEFAKIAFNHVGFQSKFFIAFALFIYLLA